MQTAVSRPMPDRTQRLSTVPSPGARFLPRPPNQLRTKWCVRSVRKKSAGRGVCVTGAAAAWVVASAAARSQGRSWRPASRARPPRRRRRSAARQAQKAAQSVVLTTRTPRCSPTEARAKAMFAVSNAQKASMVFIYNTHTRGVLEQTAHGVCHDSELCHSRRSLRRCGTDQFATACTVV